jgi:LmbE family N-acetylglucosaminyl deacetylase
MKKHIPKTAIFIGTHDDDLFLACGGMMFRHSVKDGFRVIVVILTRGITSHKTNFGNIVHPSPQEVGAARQRETREAVDRLYLDDLVYLNLPLGDGRVRENEEEAHKQLLAILVSEKPDFLYYHGLDAHPDHRATCKVVQRAVSQLPVPGRPRCFRYLVWNQNSDPGISGTDLVHVEEFHRGVLRCTLTPKELMAKKAAIQCFRSQISAKPYPGWVQPRPVLSKTFVKYHTRGREIFCEDG